MDIPPDISASISNAESLFCVDQTLVKMEPRNEYDETSIIVIKQELDSDDENETDDNGEYYSYIDTSALEVDESLISGIQNHSEEGGELSLLNSDANYVMICENIEDNSGVLHFRLLNEKPVVNTFKTVTSSIENNRQNKLKTKDRMNNMISIKIQPDVERPFKCSECDATFEVKSHLVMHELGHERYNKYKQTVNLPSTVKQPILHLCKYCDASFAYKKHLLMHEVYHENDENSMCSCRKSLRTTSDLCKCVVRECQSCHRKFFAAVKLGNWNACIKCFFLNDSNLKDSESGSDHLNYTKYRNVKTIDVKQKSIEAAEITNVKKLCYFCGKMCSNVINSGASWVCYNCWNTKMKDKGIKRIKESYPELQKRLKYDKVDCVYCSQLYPYKSLQKDHQCLHKSVYLKDGKEISQAQFENNSYIEVRLPDEKIGEHFLLSSMENSLESPILVENSPSLKDVSSIVGTEDPVQSKYTSKSLIIPSKQFRPLSNSSMKGIPPKQLKQPQSSDWFTYTDDDDDDDCGGNSDCEYQVNEKAATVEIAQEDDDSTRTVILCDKTGELIDLMNSETEQLQENGNHIVAQL